MNYFKSGLYNKKLLQTYAYNKTKKKLTKKQGERDAQNSK